MDKEEDIKDKEDKEVVAKQPEKKQNVEKKKEKQIRARTVTTPTTTIT